MELGDGAGNTSLHVAARFGNIKLMRYFVEQAGANVWALNDDGKTPCETAAEAEQSAAFKYLDALQLRMRMDDSEKADKARQRARKDWTKRLEKREKILEKERKELTAGKGTADLRRQRASESVLTRSSGQYDQGRSSAQVHRDVEDLRQEALSGRGRGFSDPVPLESLDMQRQHPDIAEATDSEDDGVFRSRSQSQLSSFGKHSSFSDMRASSLDNPTASHSKSPENLSAAQTMAMYNSSNLRSRFSLRPSVSGSSGIGTDVSGVSSVDTSMGSASGSRTAQAIARIKSLGGLNALTHSKTPGPGRLRAASDPSNTPSAGQSNEDNAFRRYRVQSDAQGGPLKKTNSAIALMQSSKPAPRASMSRSSSNASAQSKVTTYSLPAKPQPRSTKKLLQKKPRRSHEEADDGGVASDRDEEELTPMAAFLHMLNLDDHLVMLEEEHMDLDALKLCTDLDLKDLDMGLGPRRKILAAVQKRKTTLASNAHRLSDSQV